MRPSVQLPPWLERAMAEMGVKERPGPANHPRIIEYHSKTALKATDDDVPWCASFVCWCCDGIVEHPYSARARDWLRAGQPLFYPAIGCVVVLARGGGGQPGPWCVDAPGHVGFFVGFTDGGDVLLLGGNQGNMVSVVPYPISRVLGYRWPA